MQYVTLGTAGVKVSRICLGRMSYGTRAGGNGPVGRGGAPDRLCTDQGIGITPRSPLARGFVMGNRTRDKQGETARSRSDSYAY